MDDRGRESKVIWLLVCATVSTVLLIYIAVLAHEADKLRKREYDFRVAQSRFFEDFIKGFADHEQFKAEHLQAIHQLMIKYFG
jgi:uncharacterized protein YsxB (DUF464 family)